MGNETLEEKAKRLADITIENEGGQTHFYPNDEPSPELQQLIVEILNERGYKAQFYRYSNEPLSIMLSKNQDYEQDESNSTDGW